MSHFSPGFIGRGLDQFTKALLHFDGSNGSTTIVDDAAPSRVWTASGASLSTGAFKFGTASLNCGAAAGAISCPDDAGFAFGSSDFTIDFWFNAGGAGTTRQLFGQIDSGGFTSTFSVGGQINNLDQIRCSFCDGTTVVPLIGTSTVGAGWNHYAMVRSGGTGILFLNGVSEGTVAVSGSLANSAAKFAIGQSGELTASRFNGNFDEFRLSLGIARWTGNFTPPTAPY